MYTYILSALAAAGFAAAQCHGTKTIQSQADATQLASCVTWTGNIVIDSHASNAINLAGIQTIKGDLTATNVNQMSSLSADSLQSIQGTFKLDGVRALSTLSFPQLSSVTTIDWATLPRLGSLDFTTGVQLASSVSITDTNLGTLSGISLRTVDSLVLQSNLVLQKLEFPLTHFTSELTITGNAHGMSLSLPNLSYGKSFNLQNLGSLSVPNLSAVNGTLNIQSCTMKALNFPKLTNVGLTLTVSKNPQLASLQMPKLQTCSSGFVIASCPNLTKLNGFASLSEIDGNLDFSGNFNQVALPKLSLVRGAFNLQSTGNIKAECQKFASEHGKASTIRGKFTCKAEDSTPKGLNGQTSSGSKGGHGNGSTITAGGSGAASGFFPSLLAVGAAAGFTILGLF